MSTVKTASGKHLPPGSDEHLAAIVAPTYWSGTHGVAVILLMLFVTAAETITYDVRLYATDFHVYHANDNIQLDTNASLINKFAYKQYKSEFVYLSQYFTFHQNIILGLYLILKFVVFTEIYGKMVTFFICSLLAEKFQKLRAHIENFLMKHGHADESGEKCTNSIRAFGQTTENACEKLPWKCFHKMFLALKQETADASVFLSPILVSGYFVDFIFGIYVVN